MGKLVSKKHPELLLEKYLNTSISTVIPNGNAAYICKDVKYPKI